MTNLARTTRIVYSFFGAPGSGKGTLAEKCVSDLGYLSLSTGNLIRKHISEKTDLGLKVESIINSGNLISDDIISEMVATWLVEALKINSNVILDGYPRTWIQAEKFEIFRRSINKEVDFKFCLIFFDIDKKEVLKRLSNRLVCSNRTCQKVYSLLLEKPKVDKKCDYCHHDLIKRKDDEVGVISERLKVFDENKNQILDFYKKMGLEDNIIILEVDKKSPVEIFNEFVKLIENIKKKFASDDKNKR